MSQPGSEPATPARPRRAVAGAASEPPSPAASASPRFAATPRSGASPAWTPRTPGAVTPLTPGAATPQRRGGAGADSPVTPASSRRSPRVAHRGFLGTPPPARRVRTPGSVAAAGGEPDDGDDGADQEEGNFLYGTDINEESVVNEFHRFVWRFKTPETTGDKSYYVQELLRIWEEQSEQRSKGIKFPLSGQHIHSFSPKLYGHLVNFPAEVIPLFDRELWNISVHELDTEPEEVGVCQVQVHSLLDRDSKIMRSMNPGDIEKLMSLKGIVIRCSDLMPDMLSALFRCTVEDCRNQVSVPLSHWQIQEPTRCEACGTSHSFQLVHNESVFADKQFLKLQEPPELVPDGETPQNVHVAIFDDLVDTVRPGDRIEVTGIYRAAAVRPMKNWRQCSSVYRTSIDAISIVPESKGRIDFNTDAFNFDQRNVPKLGDEQDLNTEANSEHDIRWNQRVRDLGAQRDESGDLTIVPKLVQSFAPSIFEEEDVKKGLLCQLFGGTPKASGQSGRGRCRPEINSLLCGDPSTAKSQLLSYAFKLAPRGVYTSGKGSTAVGLTASINKDPTTGDLVLESGALVLSDRGVCCIDEFDKMDENARAILHEAMEQQTVSVAKAGIVCSLNARCSILASANPKESSYDKNMAVAENINLPKNLMSRFDMIWLMLDKHNKDMDSRLANHLISMYSVSGVRKRVEASIESELFRRYVSFARRWVFPQLTDEATQALVKAYTDLRNQGTSRDSITATPRILESLVRISESLCKMELREEVKATDVDEAVRLLKAATYAAAIDPETGLIDMEQLIVGMGAHRRKRMKDVEQLLKDVLAEKASNGNQISSDIAKQGVNERLGERNEQLATESEFRAAMRGGEMDGWMREQGRMLEYR